MDLDRTTAADQRDSLLELGQAVAQASTIRDMIRVVTEVAGPMVGATNATAILMDEARSKLIVHHGPAAATSEVHVVDLSDPTPAAQVARTGEADFVECVEELQARYPRFVEQLEIINWAALAAIPLMDGKDLLGVVVYRWKHPVTFTPERRELVTAISEVLAHALTRAQNHDWLLAYARRLRESNRDLDSFASAVAHDLRQPLRQLSSYVDVLFDHLRVDDIDVEAQHYGGRIRSAVSRADQLIIALLEYARAGGKPLVDEEVPLDRLVNEVIESLRLQLDDADATIRHDRLPTVQGDPDLLGQVLQNLIENAAKYREPARPVEILVSARPEEREDDEPTPWWRISVGDNGIGIAPEQLGKIFDVFNRAERETDQGGTGIGLASAKRVIERHGGTIGVEATPGVGSTFWFTLPGVAGRHRY